MYILAAMSKIYILIEEIADFNIHFEYYIIGVYTSKDLAIENCKKLFNDSTSRLLKSFKVVEYPINTPINFIDTNPENTILVLSNHY